MRENMLKLSDITFVDILDCNIEKVVNEHGKAEICGHIDKSLEGKILDLATDNSYVTLEAVDENGESTPIFSGIINNIEIEIYGDLRKLNVELVGSTYLLDLIERNRSFQDETMTYEDVLNCVNSNYQEITNRINQNEKSKIENIIVQYKETDWSFIKRMASRFNTCIIPYYKNLGICYFIGVPVGGRTTTVNTTNYSYKKSLKEYMFKSENNVPSINEGDAIYFIYESREIYDLGDNIILDGKNLYVYQVSSVIKGEELVNKYYLKTKNGFNFPSIKNKKIVGASLEGKVLDIKGDQVKVYIEGVDIKNEVSTAKWFPYSTVYSSDDGTGWYCMPEKNDKIRIYFPSDEESKAYITSSVNLTVRDNPDNKSIMNKYKKKIEFTPSSLTITNSKGMVIKLDDEEGISIISDKNINFQANEGIYVKSVNDSITQEAEKSILINQGATKLHLEDNVFIEGAQMKIQ